MWATQLVIVVVSLRITGPCVKKYATFTVEFELSSIPGKFKHNLGHDRKLLLSLSFGFDANLSSLTLPSVPNRLLQFTFVEDHFMIPDDPLGRDGPYIDMFLRRDSGFVLFLTAAVLTRCARGIFFSSL